MGGSPIPKKKKKKKPKGPSQAELKRRAEAARKKAEAEAKAKREAEAKAREEKRIADEKATVDAAQAEKDEAASVKRRGRRDTVLTSITGVSGSPKLGRKTLLG